MTDNDRGVRHQVRAATGRWMRVHIAVDDRIEADVPDAVTSSSTGAVAKVAEHKWGLVALVACLLFFATAGVPFNPETIVLDLTIVVLVDALGRQGIPGVVRVAADWMPVLAVLVFYDLTRGIADSLGMPLQLQSLIDADELLVLGGTVPTVWLQEHLIQPETQWWEAITGLVYVSHFFACFGLAGWLYIRNRGRWRRFINRFLTLNVAGMITYCLVPAAPPWYAAREGALPADIVRTTSRGFDLIGLKQAGSFLSEGQGMVNHVAAMPSLHGGYSFLFSLFLWSFATRSRWFLLAYPVAMGFTLVYSGEHYVIDIVAGWFYAWVVHVAWTRWETRRARESGPSSEPALERIVLQPHA